MPTSQDVVRSVNAGLRLRSDLTPLIVPYVEWEPSVGIAAGRINKLGADIRSFREPLSAAVKEVVIPSIRTNFDVGGRPAWEPLDQDTLKKRSVAGQGEGPLNRTGALKRGASQFNNWRITTTTAVMTNIPDRVWYGRIHQAGAERGASGGWVQKGLKMVYEGQMSDEGGWSLPARPFVMLQEEDEVKIFEIFNAWLESRVLRDFA